jgi:hypothetical protein
MKKRFILIAGFLFSVVLFSSCFHDHDISISVNDDDDVYRMRASFDEDMSDDVQEVINSHLRKHQSHAFVTVFTDKEITLDNGTRFYIKAKPGRLKIKLDRDGNPEEGCESVREMCDEIKEVLENRYDNE